MASPILLVFSMIGGLLARILWAQFNIGRVTNLCVAVLPGVLALIEIHVRYAARIPHPCTPEILIPRAQRESGCYGATSKSVRVGD